MPIEMVLTIISRDRPGVVQKLAEIVTNHSGNWIDSSLARLGGEFAGILRVTMPENCVAAFEDALTRLADQDIAVTVRRDSAAPPPHGCRARLTLTGADPEVSYVTYQAPSRVMASALTSCTPKYFPAA